MTHCWKLVGCGCVLALIVTASAGPAAEVDQARLTKAIQATLAWDYGQDPGELQYLADVVVQAGKDAALRQNVENRIIGALGSEGTKAGKAFLCRQLVIVGTPKCVPALARLLTDKDVSHMARYALERIPGEAADAALLRALGQVDDKLKVGMVYSLGRRGDKAAADAIIKLLDSSDADLVAASLVALGRVDSDEAAQALAKARRSVPDKLKGIANNAYLDCAARLAASGKADQAKAIYKELSAPQNPTMCRIAALRGLVATQGGDAVALAIGALGDKDEKVREAAIPILRDSPGEQTTLAIAAELGKQDTKVQPLLLLVLVDRGDAAALPAVIKAVQSTDEAVRLAALEALGKLGDASVVPMLLAKAVAGDGKERDAARASLDRLGGKDANAAMVKLLGSSDAKARAELVRSLGARKADDAVDAVLKAAQDKDADVRTEAMKTLRVLAGPTQAPALVQILVRITDDKQREEAERTVVSVAKQIPENQSPAKAVLAALAEASAAPVKASLVRVLGKIGDNAALPPLYRALQDADADVKDAAVRALAAWPTADPAETLWKIVQDKANSAPHRIIALRGYVEMIPRQTRSTDEGVLKMYDDALRTAWRNEEKQLVLSKLASLRHTGAMELAKGCLDDAALKPAAEAAIKNIEKLLSQPASVSASLSPDKASNALDGNAGTRWDTGTPMRGGEWFRIDLGGPQLISGIVLDTSGSGGDYPREYEIYVSPNMLGEGKLVAKGQGKVVTDVNWPPIVGRTIKIVQTGRAEGNFWSIHTLKVKSKPVK